MTDWRGRRGWWYSHVYIHVWHKNNAVGWCLVKRLEGRAAISFGAERPTHVICLLSCAPEMSYLVIRSLDANLSYHNCVAESSSAPQFCFCSLTSLRRCCSAARWAHPQAQLSWSKSERKSQIPPGSFLIFFEQGSERRCNPFMRTLPVTMSTARHTTTVRFSFKQSQLKTDKNKPIVKTNASRPPICCRRQTIPWK